jgi:murein L,D-transpeptidase YcbB/YkuD
MAKPKDCMIMKMIKMESSKDETAMNSEVEKNIIVITLKQNSICSIHCSIGYFTAWWSADGVIHFYEVSIKRRSISNLIV